MAEKSKPDDAQSADPTAAVKAGDAKPAEAKGDDAKPAKPSAKAKADATPARFVATRAIRHDGKRFPPGAPLSFDPEATDLPAAGRLRPA